jgi:T5SS/PEP-CTERM-associated repeat protein
VDDEAQGTVAIENTDWDAHEQNIFIGQAGVGQMTITGESTTRHNTAILGQANGAEGTVTVDGPDAQWNTAANTEKDLVIGGLGQGRLNILNGASVTSQYGRIADSRVSDAIASEGTVLIQGKGSRWSFKEEAFELAIGDEGTGKVIVRNGGQLDVPDAEPQSGITLGRNTHSHGTLIVDDASLQTQTTLQVGEGGGATLELLNGGIVNAPRLFAGRSGSGTTSTIVVAHEGSTLTVDDFRLGGATAGAGDLTVRDGATVENVSADMRMFGNGVTSATIEGPGSQWRQQQDLLFAAGPSEITVRQGGLLDTRGRAQVRSSDAQPSQVAISGAASQWKVGETLGIGERGRGQLEVRNGGSVDVQGDVIVGESAAQSIGIGDMGVLNGGRVESNDGRIGLTADSNGTVLVQGGGSHWLTAGQMVVGQSGVGKLSITQDASVQTNTSAYIAQQNGSRGNVVLSENAMWKVFSSVYVGGGSSGAGGQGTLQLQSGATLDTLLDVNIRATGSLTLNGGTLVANELKLDAGASFAFNSGQLKNQSGNHVPITLPQRSELNVDGTTGSVSNAGQAGPGSSPGQWTVDGDFTQTDTGTLTIEIAGDEAGVSYDLLQVLGNTTLDGQLEVLLLNGLQTDIQPGEAFTFIQTEGALNGMFANAPHNTRFTTSDGLGSFKIDYSPSNGQVTLNNFELVPEPGSASLLLTSLLLARRCWGRRPRRTAARVPARAALPFFSLN